MRTVEVPIKPLWPRTGLRPEGCRPSCRPGSRPLSGLSKSSGTPHCTRRAVRGQAASDQQPAEQVGTGTAGPPGPEHRSNSYDTEIALLAIPALAALAADPVASLVGTAFVSRLGSAPVAAVGTALSIFGALTKLLNVPLLSVTTSRVASAVGASTGSETEAVETGKACSSALIVAFLVGVAQAAFLLAFAGQGLSAWGAGPGSQLRPDAMTYLTVRALGAPATVLFMVAQGAFRGLGDTRTPLFATLMCTLVSLGLDVLLIFQLGYGVAGAAWATVIAEALAALALLGALQRRHALRLPERGDLARLKDFAGPVGVQGIRPAGRNVKIPRTPSTQGPGLLALRTTAIAGTFAIATAVAARIDVAHAAGHQICLQLWLASSLLADALAVAAQALVARLMAAKQLTDAQMVARRTVSLAGLLGLGLAGVLAVVSDPLPQLFNPSQGVMAAIRPIYPFVVLTQPLNALAFVWDGVLYGTGGFPYAATAMAVCAAPAVACMLLPQAAVGPDGRLAAVWTGLTVLMIMRTLTIWLPWRLKRGPFYSLFNG